MFNKIYASLEEFEESSDLRFDPKNRKWHYISHKRKVSPEKLLSKLTNYFGNMTSQRWPKLEDTYTKHIDGYLAYLEDKNYQAMGGSYGHLKFESPVECIAHCYRAAGVDVNEAGAHVGGCTALIKATAFALVDEWSALPAETKKLLGKCNIPSRVDFENTCELYIHYRVEAHLTALKDRIRFNPKVVEKGRKELARLGRLVTPSDSPDALLKINTAVFEHMFHSVKCKIFGFPVHHHMMIFLRSLQGSGKSEFVKKLAAPLGKFYAQIKAKEMMSGFSEPMTENFYLICMDEFSIKEGEIQDLKKMITQEFSTARKIYSQTMVEYKHNATFIALSNDPLKHTTPDYTGMRRFWEIDCTPADADPLDRKSVRLDWDTVNDIDYLAIWQAVNENEPSPIHDILEEMAYYQDTYRKRNRMEHFLEMEGYYPLGDDVTKMALTELHALYSAHCEEYDKRSEVGLYECIALVEKGTSIVMGDKRGTTIKVNKNPVARYEADPEDTVNLAEKSAVKDMFSE